MCSWRWRGGGERGGGGQVGKGQRSNLVVSASVNTTDVAEGSDLDPAAPAAKSALHRGGRGCLAGRSGRNVTRRKEKFAGGVFHCVMMGGKKKTLRISQPAAYVRVER